MSIHYFDRSRTEEDHRCPRRRYWTYDFDRKGLVPVKLNQHLAFGGAVHEALAYLLHYCKQFDNLPDMVWIKSRVRQVQDDLHAEFTTAQGFQAATTLEEGFDGEMIQVTEDQSWLIDHYCDLLEGLVVGWCLVRLPLLMQTYKVVEVETEEQLRWSVWSSASGGGESETELMFLSRPDAILERRTDGALVILSFKTVSQVNSMWLENFKTDQQTISEVLPVEARLGREVAGVQVEGLTKGAMRTEWPKGSGHWHHSSPLVWGYLKEEGGLQDSWEAKFDWKDEAGSNRRLGKGWNRQRISECYQGGIAEWVGYLYQAENELLRAQFPSPPLISRSAHELEEWQEQVKYREIEVHNALVEIQAYGNMHDKDGVLHTHPAIMRVFPKHTTGCAYDPQFHSKCPCYGLCWGSQGQDPLGCGEFKYRTPNHPAESEIEA